MLATFRQWAKGSRETVSQVPTVLLTCFSSLSSMSKQQLGPPAETSPQYSMQGSNDRFIEIQSNLRRKKLHSMSQGSNVLSDNFSNSDNLKVPIKFRRATQSQLLFFFFFLSFFFFKNRPIHFHINSNRVIRLVEKNKMTFPAFKSVSLFLPQSST